MGPPMGFLHVENRLRKPMMGQAWELGATALCRAARQAGARLPHDQPLDVGEKCPRSRSKRPRSDGLVRRGERARAAVEKSGWELRHASAELRGSAEIVRITVAQEGQALDYASAELQNSAEIVQIAVAQCGDALCCASAKLQSSAEIVRIAVAQRGDALCYASAELQSSAEIVRIAESQNGYALCFASAKLQATPRSYGSRWRRTVTRWSARRQSCRTAP